MAPAIALLLSNFAPVIAKYLGAGEKAVKVTEIVSDIATRVSGAATPEEAVEIFQKDSEKAWAFKLETLAATKALEEAALLDIQDARKRDMAFIASGKRNLRADSIYLLSVIVVVLIVLIIWQTPELSEYVKGTLTLILGRFLGYIDQIASFEFGTTRSSQKKDDTIKALSKE